MSPRGGPDAKVLVVTGQTGTGKSTICRWLAQRGAFVIDADRVGHELLARESMARELAAVFGPGILDAEGRVDRGKLGPVVFGDPAALARLNSLIHPPLVETIQNRIAELRGSRAVELIVVDAALHFDFEPRLECDAVLMTEVAPELQLSRIRERDGLEEEAARRRIERQAAIRAHRDEADRILDTSAEAGQVRREMLLSVDAMLGTQLSGSDPPEPPEGWEV